MRLHRLVLENWRGVASRSIDLSDGVTLIEGPNEIGKSSLVEALRLLIREYDSSAKQAVKAVRPVGEDVGSRVEAEISTGPYRFVYAKTFNKAKQTELRILEPAREQLAGREAHDRVEQMLEETIDPDLWEALLVDQGEKVAQATLDGSSGLSAALDEAAGGGSSGNEDPALLEAAQTEYEKYFTPRTGRPKFADQEKSVGEASERVGKAKESLAAVSADADEYERLSAEVRRRTAALPELQENAARLERQWRAVDEIRNELELKRAQVEAAATALDRAKESLEARNDLAKKIDTSKTEIKRLETEREPHDGTVESIRKRVGALEASIRALKSDRTAARAHLELTRDDTKHLRAVLELDNVSSVLKELDSIAGQIESAAETVSAIPADEQGVEELQKWTNEIRALKRQRDLAATKLTVRAEKDQSVSIGDGSTRLEAGELLERTIATHTVLDLPGVASISIDPPATAADVEADLEEAQAKVAGLLEEHRAKDLKDAIGQLTRKNAALAELETSKKREKKILAGRNRAELTQRLSSLTKTTRGYRQARKTDQPLPPSVEKAEKLASAAQAAIDVVDAEIAEREADCARQKDLLEAAVSERQKIDDLLTRHNVNLETLEAALEKQRDAKSDSDLDDELRSAQASADDAERKFNAVEARLNELNPDGAETLYRNAKQAAERAAGELSRLNTNLAVLGDRLKQAQADGRFEAVDEAGRALEEAERLWATTQRRAAAADRLWQTLNDRRNSARQAYVRPLKEAIERLGRIVFGNDFEVDIADDWSIETRTLGGRTLPFEALSIGAREQLGVLTRLAAAQIVADQGGVPLIIDDALGFSDPERLQTMGAAISAAGNSCQVIILTCTPDRFSNIGAAELVRI